MSSTRKRRAARIVGEKVLRRNDCPRFAPGDFADRPGVATPHDRTGAGRRRHPHRPAGGADGTRRHHRLVGRQPATGAIRQLAGHAMHTVPIKGRSAALRRLANRERRAAAMNMLDAISTSRLTKTSPFQTLPRIQWSRQRPTYREAEPAVIDAALRRSQRRSARQLVRVRRKRRHPHAPARHHRRRGSSWSPGATNTARCTSGPVRVRIWAPTWPPARWTAATLICPWHGLRLTGGARIRLEAVPVARRRRAGLGAPGRRRR